MTHGVTIKVLASADEVAPLPDFEKVIWGADDEAVSVNLLVATISEGGVALGAFDEHDQIVGSVYGFATNEPMMQIDSVLGGYGLTPLAVDGELVAGHLEARGPGRAHPLNRASRRR